jgi:aspartyl-tRNA(Asn)/glutamyl-tRNA(Gln) amidotransferase subunit A
VAGIRPTYGRVSRHGILPRTWSLDTVGSLARSVRDCARLLHVIAGHDPNDSTTSTHAVPDYERLLDGNIDGLKIGVPENYFFDDLAQDVQRCMDESLRQLASQGARIIRLQVPDPKLLHRLANLVSQVEAASIHAKWLDQYKDDYPLVLRTRIESGFLVPAVAYLDALSARARLLAEFVDVVFGKVDVLFTPALSMPAPSFAEITPGTSGEVMPMLARMSRCTRPFSFLGLPALSVPAGMSRANLPIGMQLVGRPFDEALLFKVGDAYQGETAWDQLAPQFAIPR